jgi:DNA-binding LacI/PurR family transcriptional regulator
VQVRACPERRDHESAAASGASAQLASTRWRIPRFAGLSPWAVEIIRGAEEAATAEGYRIAVSVVSGEPDTERWLNRLSISRTDDVILVMTELSPAYRAWLAVMHMPVVIVEPVGQSDPRIRRSERPTGPTSGRTL